MRLKFPKLSSKIRPCYKKEWTNNLITPATVSPGQPCCAIIWKIFSSVYWDPRLVFTEISATRAENFPRNCKPNVYRFHADGGDLIGKTQPAQLSKPTLCNRGLRVVLTNPLKTIVVNKIWSWLRYSETRQHILVYLLFSLSDFCNDCCIFRSSLNMPISSWWNCSNSWLIASCRPLLTTLKNWPFLPAVAS